MAETRLSNTNLGRLPSAVARYAYDRSKVTPGIVHLGLGAFYRAHGAAYTDEILSDQLNAWGIIGVSLQRPDQRDRLKLQDCLYTMVENSGDVSRARIVGSVLDVLVAPENPTAVIEALAAPATRVVTLTITEKGYCHDPATGRLSAAHPDIRHDLEHPDQPRTAIGLLVAALAKRRDRGSAPPTILCCDNLPHNGRLLAGLVRDFAALRDDTLSAWIERNAAFPSTMVDRIVPATTDEDIQNAATLTGLADSAPVVHEPFSQWVIEDTFVDGARPPWERAGAQMVRDVAPFEAMKLQMLNGAHSALAYLGYLGGHETIADCMADPIYRSYVERLWRQEIIPVTSAPEGTDLSTYAETLAHRFANTAIRHRTWQIAMDGSQKLPQRMLTTIQRRLDQGAPITGLAIAVAAWMRYVGGIDEQGRAIDVRDPLASHFAALHKVSADATARVDSLLAVDQIFGPSLARQPAFRSAVHDAYASLTAFGAQKSIAKYVG